MNISKLALVVGSTLLISQAVQAATNAHQPTSFLGPTFRGGFTNNITDDTAYSIGSEVGPNNYRLNATLGWQIFERDRVKLTAEYLWQNIHYGFISGNTKQWGNQGGLGFSYSHDFCNFMLRPEDILDVYYSQAPSKTLQPRQFNVPFDGTVIARSENRRIAGSTAYSINKGINIHPWRGAKTGVSFNYDHVSYDMKYINHRNAFGFGGTFIFDQQLARNLSMGVSAGIRKPFNNYAGNVTWRNLNYHGRWNVAFLGEYTTGKFGLPNTYNVGISADYFFDQRCPEPFNAGTSYDIMTWTAAPAVHQPVKMAITDSFVNQGLVLI